MTAQRSVTARVQVTIDVDTCSWGGSATMEQIEKQANESALGAVANMIERDKQHAVNRMRIVGTPKFVATYAASTEG